MDTITLKKIDFNHPLFAQVFALREKVLRQPLGLSLHNEDTSGDKNDAIYVAVNDDKVVGCLMARKVSDSLLKLRQMAVDPNFQAHGIGRLLVHYAESDARKYNYQKIELHARQKVQGFYERLGYMTFGPVFVEVNIPHVKMEKFL